ncbi:MAG: hypothetical protein CL608_25400 [Anaerolineaceae bacterium]|nr:hypothetical protein [Anaerolineaceae bacterium]
MVAAIGMTCLIGTMLLMMDGFWTNIVALPNFFPRLIMRFSLQAVIFGGIIACLIVSYPHIVNRSANKVRVRLLYAIMGLLVVLAFVFSEYQNYQEKLVVSDVCTQFDSTVRRRDFETAYEFMSPSYRQTHSLAQFIAGEFGEGTGVGGRITCEQRSKSVRVVLVHPSARKASVIRTPFGSLNTEIFLEKIGGSWYFTGKTGGFSG